MPNLALFHDGHSTYGFFPFSYDMDHVGSLVFFLTDSALVQDSIRCTCINDSIGVILLLTGSLLMTGMWNERETSPWMSFPRNTTQRNLYVPIISFADLNLLSFIRARLCLGVLKAEDCALLHIFGHESFCDVVPVHGLGFALWPC